MSAAPRQAVAPSAAVPVHRAGYVRAVRSEWIKARSLRSTWLLIAFALAPIVLIPILASDGSPVGADMLGGHSSSAYGASTLLVGIDFALILIAVLGALLSTSEFTTGMARNTFTATPARGAVLAAKATVASALALAIGIVGFAGSWVVNAGTLTSAGTEIDLADGETVRYLAIQLLSMVVIALLAVALGTLLRSSVGTIFTIVAMQLIAPGILLSLNSTIANWIGAVMPPMAAYSATSLDGPAPGEIALSAGGGLAVLIAWAVVPMIGAYVSLRSRDV